MMKIISVILVSAMTIANLHAQDKNSIDMIKTENLTLTQEWDKVFAKSDKVDHSKTTFVNRYGITLAADVYKPKGATGHDT